MSRIFFQDFPCAGRSEAPVLVLLHGWGMQSAVWETFMPLLTPHVHVRCIDLPGYGRSAAVAMPASLDALADKLLEVAPARAVWLGWSLGGLVAMALAVRQPSRVSHLVLMAATPCFVQRDDWSCAMSQQDFAAFAEALQQDAEAALKRFLALQCHGAVSRKEDLRFLQSCLTQQPVPSVDALVRGLAMLKDNDRRTQMSSLSVPVLYLLGEQDALVPARIAPALSSLLPSSTIRVMEGAAHVPFLSHPQSCADAVADFTGSRS